MAESKFVTDRRRRQEQYRASRPDIRPPRTRSVLGEDERLSGTMDLPEEPAPPRSAVLSLRPNPLDYLPSLPGGPAPGPRSPTPPPAAGPNPGKQADRAAVASAATAAALAEHAREDPRGQGANQKPPAPSGDTKRPAVGTGPGAAAETPARAAAAPGPTPTMVRLPDGRVVMGNNLDPYRQAGGANVSFQEAMATQGLGAPQASRFMRGREFRTMDAQQPYSEKVRALGAEGPDLSFEGDVGFGTAPPASGGPAEGYRRLSGVEQALARREWLEGRADVEQGRETERAELARRERLAEMDPLELARIQAQGRMGGELAKVELDLRSRQVAIDEYRRMSDQIEKVQAALQAAEPGSQDALALKDYMDQLVLQRRELANLTLGRYLANPNRVGDLEALMAAMVSGGGAGAGSPPTGAR